MLDRVVREDRVDRPAIPSEEKTQDQIPDFAYVTGRSYHR